MDTIYRQLCCDHQAMQQMLDSFEQLLLDLFEHSDRDPNTLSCILDALDYFSVYPDQYHHPVEDLIFAQLLRKPIHNRNAIYQVQRQHRQIATATKGICTLFYAVANNAMVERTVLQNTSSAYIQLQRNHIHLENSALFPQVERYLDTEDWRLIHIQTENLGNPFFDNNRKKVYEILHQHLTQHQTVTTAFA
ncbi:hemerythrin domain-containing protein [Microbulbifer sp. 2205BS26-8]|uniref:hemerythrin domain-containing protein n=1 Tax=Microbulbifer sp. 2205BS26-8 TaxID=3064386 RepID=UPI00273F8DEE|nr:hemerythrin domain-containing protein [Microbulbifer sp. 2205BS26-8]MDP5208621.1 hemerythrin domain-containing protein [Microbulbifer sp. 2205BS26-8]